MSFKDQIISVLLHYSLEINCNCGKTKEEEERKEIHTDYLIK